MATKTKKATKKANKKATTEQTPNQMWNNIKGNMRVWASERTYKKKTFLSFSTSLGKKTITGDYDNLYFDVFFKKDEYPEVEEGAFEIKVKKGFLTLSVYSDGSVHPAIMVMDYDFAEDEEDEEDDEDDDDDDLPF